MSKQSETYFARAQADLAEAGGRFARPKPTVTSGAGGAGSAVPKQPATTSPWARHWVPPTEPPLGIDVNAMEPVGTAAEVGRSLAAIEQETEEPENE
jgi:hypothetical protein